MSAPLPAGKPVSYGRSNIRGDERRDPVAELTAELTRSGLADEPRDFQDRIDAALKARPDPFERAGEAGRRVLKKLEEAIAPTQVESIAETARSLTYGEMIAYAESLYGCAPDGGITKENLPAVIHRWATGYKDPKHAETSDQEAQVQDQGGCLERQEAGRDTRPGQRSRGETG